MDVVILLVFISLILVSLGLLFFFSRLRDGDFEHGDRLSILPLTDDEPRRETASRALAEDDPRRNSADGSVNKNEGGSTHGSR